MGNALAIQEIKDTDTQNKQKYRWLRQNNDFPQQTCRYYMAQTIALTLAWGRLVYQGLQALTLMVKKVQL